MTAQEARTSPLKTAPLLTLLALGNFVVGMGAFVVIGIVSPIADGLGVSKADAGVILTSYAIAYSLLSPVGAAFTGKLSRRAVLAGSLAFFCLGSLLSALSTSLLMLSLSRVVVALGAALYAPLSAGVAVAISTKEQRGRALSKAFVGMTMAQVVGVPVGSWMGFHIGWHSPFLLVAGLAAVCAAIMWRYMPRDISVPESDVRATITALGNLKLMMAVTFTATLMGAVYIVFTFFGPLVQASTRNANELPLYFMLFGIGAMAGNYVGGYLSDRIGARRTLIVVCAAHMVMLPMFSIMPWNPWLLAFFVTVWSGFAWCFMSPQQARLVTITPTNPSLALGLNSAMVYAGIAVGSAIGSRLLDWEGLSALGIAAGIGAGVALIHLLVSDRLAHKG